MRLLTCTDRRASRFRKKLKGRWRARKRHSDDTMVCVSAAFSVCLTKHAAGDGVPAMVGAGCTKNEIDTAKAVVRGKRCVGSRLSRVAAIVSEVSFHVQTQLCAQASTLPYCQSQTIALASLPHLSSSEVLRLSHDIDLVPTTYAELDHRAFNTTIQDTFKTQPPTWRS
jgi:hypothetical protein